jgi:hypothetical protein
MNIGAGTWALPGKLVEGSKIFGTQLNALRRLVSVVRGIIDQ